MTSPAFVARRQHGRTLIEVLVAITIGLMLTIGILSIYAANRQTYRASSDLQRMQSAGQLALDRLAYQIRMAGYGQLLGNFANVSNPSTFTGNPVWACAGGFSNPTEASATPACAGTTGAADALQVRYQVEAGPTAGSGESRDCLGFEVPADASGLRIAQNRFYIAISNGAPTLMCLGNGSPTPQPLIPNVEDLQVRLRIGDPFTRAERVVDPDGFADWGRVLGVELCVQVRSEETGLATGQQAGVDCQGRVFPNDGRLRRVFTQVVTLRNRML
jgi:type IV pilus assembly protein PilW